MFFYEVEEEGWSTARCVCDGPAQASRPLLSTITAGLLVLDRFWFQCCTLTQYPWWSTGGCWADLRGAVGWKVLLNVRHSSLQTEMLG